VVSVAVVTFSSVETISRSRVMGFSLKFDRKF
jgi:hypothetical protein